MKIKRMIAAMLILAATVLAAGAEATTLQRAWMEYEDYSGNEADQSIEDPAILEELEAMLLRARDNPDQLDGCTLNATLFCLSKDGAIYDFACATDGCPFIQGRKDEKVYNLGVDYQRFWEIFDEVRQGMGFDASEVFDW